MKLINIVIIGLFTLTDVCLSQEVVIWQENFESGIGDWYPSNGVWEIKPSSKAYDGTSCAGTVLEGNYPSQTSSILISPTISIPALSQSDEFLELRFWHWFSYYYETSSYHDYGQVVIRVKNGSSWGDWVVSSIEFINYSNVWTVTAVDLTAYASQQVQIGFSHQVKSSNYYKNNGWFIDDISINKRKVTQFFVENFENGFGDWYATNGVWKVGSPGSGTFEGLNCVGTCINTPYPGYTDSILVTPIIPLPRLNNSNETIGLRFRHWFSYYYETSSYHDSGQVVIREKNDTEWSKWISISSAFIRDSKVWTQFLIDLNPYAGKQIQIGFKHEVMSGNYYDNPGWFIDQVEIIYPSSIATPTPVPTPTPTPTPTPPPGEMLIGSGFFIDRELLSIAQRDVYLFEGEAGETVVLNLSGAGKASAYPPTGSPIEFLFENTVYFHRLQQSGLYRILIGGKTGEYSFSFHKLHDETRMPVENLRDGGNIYSGEFRSGVIDVWSDIDAYTFVGREGATFIASLSKNANSSNDFVKEYRMMLFGPSGGEPEFNVKGSSINIEGHSCQENGDYTLIICASSIDPNKPLASVYDLSTVCIGCPAVTPIPKPTPTFTPLSQPYSPIELFRVFPLNETTAADNRLNLDLKEGFEGRPPGDIQFGSVPEDSTSTFSDGHGVSIQLDPGEVFFVLLQDDIPCGDQSVMMRLSVRADSDNANIAFLALDSSFDGSITTRIPKNAINYNNRWGRMILLAKSDNHQAIRPAIQVYYDASLADSKNPKPITVYLDNLEIYLMDNQARILPENYFQAHP